MSLRSAAVKHAETTENTEGDGTPSLDSQWELKDGITRFTH